MSQKVFFLHRALPKGNCKTPSALIEPVSLQRSERIKAIAGTWPAGTPPLSLLINTNYLLSIGGFLFKNFCFLYF